MSINLPTLLCLSSGLTPQYKLDVLRSLALPKGGYIQYRYGEDIVSDGLHDRLEGNGLTGAKVLLAHVDCSPAIRKVGANCPIMPCRHATLIGSRRIGTRFFLELRMEEFATCSDLTGFQLAVTGNRPRWPDEAGKENPIGHWCLESQAGRECSAATDLTAWEAVVTALRGTEDFREQPFFFAIEGLAVRKDKTLLEPQHAEYHLKAETDYDLRIYHFHPEGDSKTMAGSAGVVKVELAAPYLEPVTNPAMSIDSPYDIKTFHMRTLSATKEEFASIVVRIDDRNTDKPFENQPELYIPVRVEQSFWRPFLVTLLLGGLLAIQQQVTIAVTKGWPSLSVTLGTCVLGLLIAAVAVLGLKRPV